jgi:hypothetical protein
MTRPVWILTCALAVVGAFFLVLQTAWMLKVEPEWLPYVAHPLGALLAGLAISRAASASQRAALIGGMVAVGLLALISYALPRAFTLTAARSPNAALLVPVIAIASGVACALGARLQGAESSVWRPTVAAFVATCTIQLGGRIAFALGLPATPMYLAVFGIVAAAIAGALVQATAGGDCKRDVAIGVVALMLFSLLRQSVMHSAAIGLWDVVLFVGAPLGAAAGARLVQRA